MMEMDDNIFRTVTNDYEEASFLLLYAISNQGGDPGIDCFPWHGFEGTNARTRVPGDKEGAWSKFMNALVQLLGFYDMNLVPGIHMSFGSGPSKI